MQIIIPLLQLPLIAVAFALCFYLFLSVKTELHTSDKRRIIDGEVARARIETLERELNGIRRDFVALQMPALPATSNGINHNNRTQAIRMIKLGEGPERISAALSLPRKEVELLIKVQRLLLDSSSYPSN